MRKRISFIIAIILLLNFILIPLKELGKPKELNIHCFSNNKNDILSDEIVGWAKIR